MESIFHIGVSLHSRSRLTLSAAIFRCTSQFSLFDAIVYMNGMTGVTAKQEGMRYDRPATEYVSRSAEEENWG